MAENFFKFLYLSTKEKESQFDSSSLVINNTFQKRIKTERFLSEKKKEGNKFQSESSTKKKKEEKRCIFFPTFHLSGHKIFAPKRPCLRARIHFAFCITPSSRSLRVPSCPLLPDISSREETNRHREREREWRKITNERGVEKRGGWKRWLIIFLPFPPKIHANSGHACLVERELSLGDDLWRARFMRPNPADVFTLVLEKIYRRPPIPMGENDPETFVGQLARRYRSPLHGYRFELRTTHVRLMIESLNSSLHEIYI